MSRSVRGRIVPDKNGMPVIELNHDDLVRAAWEITMETFFPKPAPLKPPSRWQRLKTWLLEPKDVKK